VTGRIGRRRISRLRLLRNRFRAGGIGSKAIESLVGHEDHRAAVLVPRQDMTGADRAWAARYQEGDVIRCTKGSRQLGIKPGEYGTVREVDARNNTLKVELKDGL
jgi:hypothetical protein